MANSLYNQSVPVFIKYLKNLSALLEKGEQFCNDTGMKEEQMLESRLAADMRALPYQVQSCSNTAKFLAVRLNALEDIYLEDNEATFSELQTRITTTISLLNKIDATKLNAATEEPVLMKTKMGDFHFQTGQEYVSNYAIPTFHFHLGTAYCILRHLGVGIGAFDYLGKETFVKAQAH